MLAMNIIMLYYILSSIIFGLNTLAYYNGCGGNFEVNGVITVCSPNFPLRYLRLSHCEWNLRSALEFKITLHIHGIEGNMCQSAACDALRLWNGERLVQMSMALGNDSVHTPIRHFSVRSLRMTFDTDGSHEYKGFCLVAETYTQAIGRMYPKCGGTLKITGPTTIQSPKFPSNYDNNLDCTWYLHTESGQALRINITDVDIEYSRTCSNDVLRLWTTNNGTHAASYQLCGSLAMVLTLRTQQLWIHFRSDYVTQLRGFRITVDVDGNRYCDGVSDVYEAVSRGDMHLVKYAIDRGFDINCKFKSRSILHVALSNQSEAIVNYTLGRGLNVDALDGSGRTPLFTAVSVNSVPLASLLLDNGANINVADANNETILHAIARKGNTPLLRLMLKRGADDRLANKDGLTAIHVAAENGHIEVCELLLNTTNLVSAKTNLGKTPLHLAAGKFNVDMVKLLVESGAQLNDSDSEMATPLHYSVLANSVEVARYLLLQGADTTAKNARGETALLCAARLGHMEITKLLLTYGAMASSRRINATATRSQT